MDEILRIIADKDHSTAVLRLSQRISPTKYRLLGEALINLNTFNDGEVQCADFWKGGVKTGSSIFLECSTETDTDEIRQFVYLNCNQIILKLYLKKICLPSIKSKKSMPLDVIITAYSSRTSSMSIGDEVSPVIAPPSASSPLPMNITEIPFSFILPSDLPSSLALDSQCHVSYSILCTWEGESSDTIASTPIRPSKKSTKTELTMRMRPEQSLSCRVFFSVLQPSAAAMYLRPQQQILTRPLKRWPWPIPARDQVFIECGLQRSGFAPGETVDLMLSFFTARRGQEQQQSVQQEFRGEVDLFLIQEVHLWVERSSGQGIYLTRKTIVESLTGVALPAGDEPIRLTIPPLSPSFDGFQEQSQKEGVSSEADPLKWRYFLEVHVRVQPLQITTTEGDIRFKMGGQPLRMQFPVVVCSLGLQHLPPMNVQRFWQRPDLHPPVRSIAGWIAEWNSLPEVIDALKKIQRNLLEDDAKQQWICSNEVSVMVRDVEEDFACIDLSLLLLRPKYILSSKRDEYSQEKI
mmetsp:Transcript_20427/g.28214  ORF Transcript_20427/g.28214 Transcript_20427/m.28214 type:complete len:521 (+) Transcript_20427:291-1853(+)